MKVKTDCEEMRHLIYDNDADPPSISDFGWI